MVETETVTTNFTLIAFPSNKRPTQKIYQLAIRYMYITETM